MIRNELAPPEPGARSPEPGGGPGGSTEMYKPFGKNIRCLDANSLFPSMMSSWDFGVGRIFEFKGDISILPDFKTKYWIAIPPGSGLRG